MYPYKTQAQFELAQLLFSKDQMSAGNIDELLRVWAATLYKHHDDPPFQDAKDLYKHIDNTLLGEVKWQSFNMTYNGARPDHDEPAWMASKCDVWFRDPHIVAQNMLSNPDFNGEIDYAVMRQYEAKAPHGRHLQNFMGGEWAWKHAVGVFNIFIHTY